MKKESITKESLFKNIKSYITNEDSLKLIDKAYEYAKDKHQGQMRKSGDPYFVHLMAVANELAKYHSGPKTICAGLLHDVIEDCGVSKEEFIKEFDEDIYELVEAVTKIGNLQFKDEKEYLAANHRKIFVAMAKDIRVILIKLCDRLHNMRTLEYMAPDRQQKIAQETMDVYAPIAHRLGIAEMKNELEDLSFSYLNNDKYHEIAHLVESKKTERDDQIEEMIENITKILKEHNIPFRIFGRSKHLYSIYKKMVTKNKRFDEILDLLAIRIVTETELNCYEILGYIHAEYKPIPGRLKDYIAMPKMNMYQSLHTTIVGSDGRIYEVQIRTEQMDSIAEKGIAAHWSYKEGQYDKAVEQKEIMKELEWIHAFEESESDDTQFMDTVTTDIFNANVYVMTPKGRVIDLPHGATPLDFAYRIHTEVGHQTVGALVNGVLVPLNTVLKTGDVVELKTNKNSSPSEDWLKIVKTNSAKNRIRAFFQKRELEKKEETIKFGEQLLKDEMKRRDINVEEYFNKDKFEHLYKAFEVSNYNDFMYAIGVKSLSALAVLEKLVKLGKRELDENELQIITKKNRQRRSLEKNDTGIYIEGISGMKVNLSPCCSPVYGDEIVGYVSKGQGIKVHRKDCPNIVNEKSRIIDVKWDEEKPTTRYESSIKIIANDRSFLLTDIVTCVAQYKANLIAVNSSVNNENLTATTTITITVTDAEHLNNIIANLKKVNSVIEVERCVK